MPVKIFAIVAASTAFLAAQSTIVAPTVQADDDALKGFIGGVAAARIGQNMRARTRAEQEQAYYAQQQAAQPVQQAAPAAAPAQSTQQKLEQLDQLAAGGYITPEEYKAKRQQIIDSM